ncbi:MAG: 3-hydroxyacyl-CoA dehydrogenase/enoyl-CoA hydratase family protein [Elusimicrobia bacterium]|nr:3-hydroxyacyl-CoA dehydrogenase/enoyl-CoA hydratase family protein [Elusimicrobiota bacterium]
MIIKQAGPQSFKEKINQRSFESIGVVGAGTMGSAIAQRIAMDGYRVAVVDQNQDYLDKALGNIQNVFKEGCAKKVLKPDQAEAALSRLKFSTELESLAGADLVIEAIYEDQEAKEALFKSLQTRCAPATIFATNTSSLSVEKLSRCVSEERPFLGLHFFYHPVKNRLLEIIPTAKASRQALAGIDRFAKSIGKVPILTKDTPGFAVNRFFVPWLNEAVRIVQENAANIATVEEAAKKSFGIDLGPFALMNATGVAIAYHAAKYLGKSLGNFYDPAEFLSRQQASRKPWVIDSGATGGLFDEVAERLWGVVFWVAACLDQEKVAGREDIDRGARIGLRWSQGPFETMNAIGLEAAAKQIEKVCQRHSLRLPQSLKQVLPRRNKWELRYVDLVEDGAVARVIINRPEVMNALNRELLEQIEAAVLSVAANPGARLIVLEGTGKAFVAGADIKFFVQAIEQKDIEEIVELTKLGQRVLKNIEASKKPVMAKLEGLALGGGAELALACKWRLATEKALLGFPETGLGIYPGLGGTQRLPRLIGKELAKYFILTGKPIDAALGYELGLLDVACPVGQAEDIIRKTAQTGTLERRDLLSSTHLEGPSRAEFSLDQIKKLFSEVSLHRLRHFEGAGDETPLKKEIARFLARKAPLALKLAEELIEGGLKTNLDEGLRLETSRIAEIFSTADAREGLRALLESRAPIFQAR